MDKGHLKRGALIIEAGTQVDGFASVTECNLLLQKIHSLLIIQILS